VSTNGRLLNATDVAGMLGMRVDYIYALARRDEIPHLRFGRTLRFRSEAIEEWLRGAERGRVEESN
jgi:excisionase family DNA binding protein